MIKFKSLAIISLVLGMAFNNSVIAAEKDDRVIVGTSIYAGWMPWYHIKSSGIMDQVNKKYGTNVEIRTYGTYDASFSDYTGRAIQGVTLTNMDAILNPADAGIRSIALINGDASHGNDAIVAKRETQCKELKGRKVYLMQGTVSQYLLNSYLETCGLDDSDVSMVNTTDADIATLFLNSNDPELVVVTWNPVVQTIMADPKAVKLFDSSQIEDQILDTMYVIDGLHDDVYKAITEAWYTGLAVMSSRSIEQKEMIEVMASESAVTSKQLLQQFKTTKFYETPEKAKAFTESQKLKDVMLKVTQFIQDKDMLPTVDNVSDIGIQYPDGTVLGNKDNIQIIFTTKYL